MGDEFISPHVPKTEWFHAASFQSMFRAFPTLYIKPDKGSSGLGIIRVKRLNDSQSLISFSNTSKRCINEKLLVEIRKRMHPQKKYIIQQGIQLATYHRRPFDVRVVLQKPLNKWQLTWMSAKIAPRATSFVTNVARGAVDAKLIGTIEGSDQSLNKRKILAELKNVSHRIASKLGSRFPIRIVGLDMAIDKKGKLWFIEANTNPSFHGLSKFDPQQYQRYLRAKRLIEAHSGLRSSNG